MFDSIAEMPAVQGGSGAYAPIAAAGEWEPIRGECPVCLHTDHTNWCRRSTDGQKISCRRQPAGSIKQGTDSGGVPYFIHNTPGANGDGGNALPSPRLPKKAPDRPRADADTLHAVYSSLLSRLALSDDHRANLMARGLDAGAIERGHYRSLGVKGRDKIAGELAAEFGREEVLSVPGFWVNGPGFVAITGLPGLLIPVRDGTRIVAIKVRLDQPGNGPKYAYLSSTSKAGPGPGSPVHVPVGTPPKAETVRIAEGEFKADVCSSLSDVATIGFPGVSSWRKCLDVLAAMGAKTVRLAFDADAATNEHVGRALHDCAKTLVGEGYAVEMERWDAADGKGVDDVLAAGKPVEVIVGPAAMAAVRETARVAAGGVSDPEVEVEMGDRVREFVEANGVPGLMASDAILGDLAKLKTESPGKVSAIKAWLKVFREFSARDFDDELKRRKPVARRASSAGGNGTTDGMTTAGRSGPFNLTDLGNAERLTSQHGGDMRYCHPWKKWLVFDGKRWDVDKVAEVKRRAHRTARAIYKEAAAEADDEKRKTISGHARKTENGARLAAMLQIAEAMQGVPVLPEALDIDPWLFNCRNGTLDLRTGTLRPHDRADMVTKLCPIDFDVNAKCPLWLATLEKFFAREDPKARDQLVDYWQQVCGYALVGIVRDHVLPVAYGKGSNGKSTILGTMLEVFGSDYAMKCMPDMLMAKQSETHPTDRADLFGKRLVVAIETDSGRRLNETMVKELTGGDKIRARRMREDPWEFSPTHTLIMATNHKPGVRGTDNGIWRRLKLIPFTVSVNDAAADKAMPEKLRAEYPGILAWCVRGCQKWAQSDGLEAPAEVKEATAKYRQEQDIIGAFLETQTFQGPQFRVKATELYQAYATWVRAANEAVITQTQFGTALNELGFEGKKSGVMWYLGIALKPSLEDTSDNDSGERETEVF